MRRLTASIIFAASIALGVASLGGNARLPGQGHVPSMLPAFEAGRATHETRTDLQTELEFPNVGEIPAEAEIEIPAPTRSSFMANWKKVSGATGYRLDVSTSSSFNSYVDGYEDLTVGNVTGRVVTGLSSGTTYYYRVRAYDVTGAFAYSDVTTVTTELTTGLNINATFDSSITNHPNAAAIEATINRAIAIYESLFSDPITIQILFRYTTTAPDGTPLSAEMLGRSDSVVYPILWNTYINALRADAKTGNDNLANASLPGTALSSNITSHSGGGRAVGLNTPPAMFANGTTGNGGPYDGIVTLNSAKPFQFTRPPSAGNHDAQRATEHEIDHVIGLSSRLGGGGDLHPQDLFSWSSPGVRNLTSSGTRYFSINSGSTNIVNFNQASGGAFGDWLSTACPQANPYVQNAFGCLGQFSDVTATSPEGVNLDVIGYDLVAAPAGPPTDFDFNNDGHPDYLLFNSDSGGTVIWYLNNYIQIASAAGPIVPAGWEPVGVGDFNSDSHPDYLLFNPDSGGTVIWYLNNYIKIASAAGPIVPVDLGWEVVGVGDFNSDSHPDYLLFNPVSGGTVIWYLNNYIKIASAAGPIVVAGWEVVGVGDFNSDSHPDYLLFNPVSGGTVIWYLNNYIKIASAAGPIVPVDLGWEVVAP